MFVRGVAYLGYGLFNAIFRPREFVQTKTRTYSSSRLHELRQLVVLGLVWVVNVVLYALPLTMAGIGFTEGGEAPVAFAALVEPFVISPDAVWQLLVGTVQNSIFLTVATGMAFLAFHGSITLVTQTRGLLQSLHTVVYTTSAYLVGMFTIVMYLSTTPGLETARDFVLALQSNFFHWLLESLGLGLTMPGVRPGPLTLAGATAVELFVLALLVVLTLYFLYSMYLGARLNHDLTRIQSSVVVLGVLASPVIYIVGSAIVTLVIEAGGIAVI